MKIGSSLGRCVRDIVCGLVTVEDIAFIITGTYITDEEKLAHAIEGYAYRGDYLQGLNIERCQEVALELWRSNRILQPRREGMHRHKQPENAVWVDMFPTTLSTNPAVKSAWDNYRLMIHMTENVDNEAMEAFR